MSRPSKARTIAVDDKTHQFYLPVATPNPPPPGGGRGRGNVPDSFRVIVVGK